MRTMTTKRLRLSTTSVSQPMAREDGAPRPKKARATSPPRCLSFSCSGGSRCCCCGYGGGRDVGVVENGTKRGGSVTFNIFFLSFFVMFVTFFLVVVVGCSLLEREESWR